MVTQTVRPVRPSGVPVPPDPLLARLTAMEAQIAEVSGRQVTVLEKLDSLRAILSGHRKENYTIEEVADLAGRSAYTIRRWVAEQKLKAVRIAEGGPRGRLLVPRAELERLVASARGAEIPAVALAREGK